MQWGLRETAAPRNKPGRVQLFQRSFGDAGAHYHSATMGSLRGTVWPDVAKLLPEESLSRGLWVKGNTLLCPEHLHGLPLGAILNPMWQLPSRSDKCALPAA